MRCPAKWPQTPQWRSSYTPFSDPASSFVLLSPNRTSIDRPHNACFQVHHSWQGSTSPNRLVICCHLGEALDSCLLGHELRTKLSGRPISSRWRGIHFLILESFEDMHSPSCHQDQSNISGRLSRCFQTVSLHHCALKTTLARSLTNTPLTYPNHAEDILPIAYMFPTSLRRPMSCTRTAEPFSMTSPAPLEY